MTTPHPYATREYANTLRHVGEPLYVAPWRSWIIVREIVPGCRDAMGPYPLAMLAREADVKAGLDALRRQGLVSVTLVVDSLAADLPALHAAFEFVRAFKTQHLVDQVNGQYLPSRHHDYEIRRAGRRGVQVREVRLQDVLDGWTALYDGLVARHGIEGVQRFPRASFEALLSCSGMRTVVAYIGEELVCGHIWVEHQGVVRSHLGASSPLGYASSAAYAVYDYSIRRFAGCVVNLGGAAGTQARADDGLARFKAGFANATATTYLAGCSLDPSEYARLSAQRKAEDATDYFPAYRAPVASLDA